VSRRNTKYFRSKTESRFCRSQQFQTAWTRFGIGNGKRERASKFRQGRVWGNIDVPPEFFNFYIMYNAFFNPNPNLHLTMQKKFCLYLRNRLVSGNYFINFKVKSICSSACFKNGTAFASSMGAGGLHCRQAAINTESFESGGTQQPFRRRNNVQEKLLREME
jgi:hypothetical protein